MQRTESGIHFGRILWRDVTSEDNGCTLQKYQIQCFSSRLEQLGENLGDRILFLSGKSSVSICTTTELGWEGNRIYYIPCVFQDYDLILNGNEDDNDLYLQYELDKNKLTFHHTDPLMQCAKNSGVWITPGLPQSEHQFVCILVYINANAFSFYLLQSRYKSSFAAQDLKYMLSDSRKIFTILHLIQ